LDNKVYGKDSRNICSLKCHVAVAESNIISSCSLGTSFFRGVVGSGEAKKNIRLGTSDASGHLELQKLTTTSNALTSRGRRHCVDAVVVGPVRPNCSLGLVSKIGQMKTSRSTDGSFHKLKLASEF
jgi:hypothetical protein